MNENLNSCDSNDTLDELYHETWRSFTPTEEEKDRVLPDADLIRLCKKDVCTVNMNRWNPLYDFYRYYKKRGKLDGKPPQKINQLLLKTANRYKNNPKYTYTEDDIEKVRYAEWKTRKLWNLLWLQDNNSNGSETQSGTDRSTTSTLYTVIESAPQTEANDAAVVPESHNSLMQLNSEAEACYNTESFPMGTVDLLETDYLPMNSDDPLSNEMEYWQNMDDSNIIYITISTSSTSEEIDGDGMLCVD